jgi:hypothetical protein
MNVAPAPPADSGAELAFRRADQTRPLRGFSGA